MFEIRAMVHGGDGRGVCSVTQQLTVMSEIEQVGASSTSQKVQDLHWQQNVDAQSLPSQHWLSCDYASEAECTRISVVWTCYSPFLYSCAWESLFCEVFWRVGERFYCAQCYRAVRVEEGLGQLPYHVICDVNV